jgi:quercetin dioxygenase-like cupin family protein
MKPTRVIYAQVQPVAAFAGITRRTLAWGERMMVTENILEAGAVLPLHNHPHEQITTLVSGELELRVGEETFVLGPGDSLLVPSGASHAGVARQRSVAIDTFAPPREDYK